MLLNDRDFFRRHLDSKIAAGDHDSVGSFENLLEMVDGLRLFELGDDRNLFAIGGDDLFHHLHVGGAAHERDGDRVDAVREAKVQVLAVFFRKGGDRERDSGKVDAFVFAEHAAVEHIAEHIFTAHAADPQFDEAITEQDPGSGGEFAGEIGKGGGDARGGAGNVLRGDGYDRAGLQQNGLVAIEQASADFRALQILQDAEGAPLL